MEENKDLNFLLKNLNEQNLKKYASSHLSREKQARLSEILKDKNKMNKILSSPEAKQIIKKLKDEQNG